MGGGYGGSAGKQAARYLLRTLQAVLSGACIKAILAEGQGGNAEGGSQSNGDCHSPTQRRIMEMCPCPPILSRHPRVAAFFLHGFCVAVKLSALEITCQNLY